MSLVHVMLFEKWRTYSISDGYDYVAVSLLFLTFHIFFTIPSNTWRPRKYLLQDQKSPRNAY